MSRRIVYPYTLCSKIALFPYKFHYDNCPIYKCYLWAVVICAPIFYKIQTIVCSEGNYLKLEEFKRKELDEIRTHAEHLN